MSDEAKCRFCGEAPTHGETCCWCWVVEINRPPFEGHPSCVLAAKRIAPIKTRFKTAIEATRENCITVMHEGLRQPLEAMPRILRTHFRSRPETALQAILQTVAENLTMALRERIKA